MFYSLKTDTNAKCRGIQLFYRTLILGATFLLVACGGDSGSSSSGAGSSQSTGGNDSTEMVESPVVVDANGVEIQPTPIVSPASGAPTTTPTTVARVGPNLAGETWVGYFKDRKGAYTPLTASIVHEGDVVTIRTTKPTGVARVLSGRIQANGKMLLYDTFDKEDWTTLFGPASTNSINLADFVKQGTETVNTNILILKR